MRRLMAILVATMLIILVLSPLSQASEPSPRCQATIVPKVLQVFSADGAFMGEVSKYLPDGTLRPVGIFGCIPGWYLITPDNPPGTAQIVRKEDLRIEDGCDPCHLSILLPMVEVQPRPSGGELEYTITKGRRSTPKPSWQPLQSTLQALPVLPLTDTSGWCPMCGKYLPPKAGIRQFLEERTICLKTRGGDLVSKTGRVYRESDGMGHWDIFIEVRQGILGLFKAERIYWGDPRIVSYRGCSDAFVIEAPWYMPEDGWHVCPKTDPPPPQQGCRWVREKYPGCGWWCLP